MPGRCHPEPFDRLRAGSAEGSKALRHQSSCAWQHPPQTAVVVSVWMGSSGRDKQSLSSERIRFLDSARKDIFMPVTMKGPCVDPLDRRDAWCTIRVAISCVSAVDGRRAARLRRQHH